MARPKPPDGATERMTIVLPAEVVVRVKRIAGRIATPPSVLVRQWIIERLDAVPARGTEEAQVRTEQAIDGHAVMESDHNPPRPARNA